jgi:hypothetical protein
MRPDGFRLKQRMLASVTVGPDPSGILNMEGLNAMLILKRKPGEKVVISGPCEIMALGHDRIGVIAEPHVEILRSELLENDPTDVIEPEDGGEL